MAPPSPAAEVPRGVTQLSCVHCRTKKLKCTRALPRCARCEGLKQKCIYPASKQHNSGRRRQMKGLADEPGQYHGSWSSGTSGWPTSVIELISWTNLKNKPRKLAQAACDSLFWSRLSRQQILGQMAPLHVPMKRKTSTMKSFPALRPPLIICSPPGMSLRQAEHTMH